MGGGTSGALIGGVTAGASPGRRGRFMWVWMNALASERVQEGPR